MNTRPSVITPTSKLFVLYFVHNDTDVLSSSVYKTIGTTSNLVYETLLTTSYTIDVSGVLSVKDIYIQVLTDNDANGECKIQISGDGGSTFVDMTGDIGTGTDLTTGGPGLWISSIDIGANKLQIRVLGRSTNGSPADIKISNRFILNQSIIEMIVNKTIF